MRAGKDECATPAKLVQNYVVCELDKKLDVLLGFIKTHIKSKMIVFFTSCAQVLYLCCVCVVCIASNSVLYFHHISKAQRAHNHVWKLVQHIPTRTSCHRSVLLG